MASTHKEIWIDASPNHVWDAVSDLGALHTRLVPGFVVDTKMEGEERVVTFGNGMTVREPILSVDHERRRLAWAGLSERMKHYSASLEISPEANGTRVRWTSDFLPHDLAEGVGAMQEQGLNVMKATLEKSASAAR